MQWYQSRGNRSSNPASYSRPVTVSPVSPFGTPTLDEARRALQLIVNYFQHQTTDLYPQEYVTIGKLMERFDLVKDQINTPPGERLGKYDDAPHINRTKSTTGLA